MPLATEFAAAAGRSCVAKTDFAQVGQQSQLAALADVAAS
jgi:hypothetical protein